MRMINDAMVIRFVEKIGSQLNLFFGVEVG
jgi:hypothetical protein